MIEILILLAGAGVYFIGFVMDTSKQLMICEKPQSKEVDWEDVLDAEIQKQYFINLAQFVKEERKTKKIFPTLDNMLRAFELVQFEKIKVVILGQDPYHGEGQADGLAFSVPKDQKIPPSLRNILKEIESDLSIEVDTENGDLTRLANQGILLLNTIMTVEENNPASHANKGWEQFTDHVVQQISSRKENIVFILWGKFAQARASLIDKNKHLVLTAAHPSPFSAHKGFFGCKHFSQTNSFLREKHNVTIKW